MRTLPIFFAFILILIPSLGHADSEFHYDSKDGKCKNAQGLEGLNNVSSKDRLIFSKDGECGNFESVDILHPSDSLNGFDGWNFRGADLSTLLSSGGDFCGVNFTDADLRGSNLNDLRTLYTCIEGTTDQFTKFTEKTSGKTFGCSKAGENHIRCVN